MRNAPVLLYSALLALTIQAGAGAVPKAPERPRLLFTRAEIERRMADPEDPLSRHKDLLPGPGMQVDPSRIDTDYLKQCEMQWILENLGLAYQCTGKQEYADKALTILEGLAAKDFPYWSKNAADSNDIGGGNLFIGMAISVDLCGGAWPPERRLKLLKDLQDFICSWHEKYKSYWSYGGRSNHTAVAAGGMGLLALSILGEPGLDDAKTRKVIEDATGIIQRCYTLFNSDGAYPGDAMYCMYNLHNSLPFARALKRTAGKDIVSGTGVAKAAEWLPYTRRFAGKPDVFEINDTFQPPCFGIDATLSSGLAYLGALVGPDHPFTWMCHDMFRDPLAVTGGVGASVESEDWTDWILVSTSDSGAKTKVAGGRPACATDARMAIVRFRRGPDGALLKPPERYLCFDGERLSVNSKKLVSSPGKPVCVSGVAEPAK